MASESSAPALPTLIPGPDLLHGHLKNPPEPCSKEGNPPHTCVAYILPSLDHKTAIWLVVSSCENTVEMNVFARTSSSLPQGLKSRTPVSFMVPSLKGRLRKPCWFSWPRLWIIYRRGLGVRMTISNHLKCTSQCFYVYIVYIYIYTA